MINKKGHCKYDDKRTCIMKNQWNQYHRQSNAAKQNDIKIRYLFLNMKTWNHICTVFLVIPSVLVLLVKSVAYCDLLCNYLTAEPMMNLISYLIRIFWCLLKSSFMLLLCFCDFHSVCVCGNIFRLQF